MSLVFQTTSVLQQGSVCGFYRCTNQDPVVPGLHHQNLPSKSLFSLSVSLWVVYHTVVVVVMQDPPGWLTSLSCDGRGRSAFTLTQRVRIATCCVFQEIVTQHASLMVKGMLSLLDLCPQEVAHLRKELLIAARHILATDLRSSTFDARSHQIRAGNSVRFPQTFASVRNFVKGHLQGTKTSRKCVHCKFDHS